MTTWGESHGPAIGCVVDGCPSGLDLSAEDIQKDLDRRKPGTSDIVTARKEGDLVEILSGVHLGKTLGTPISLMIRNTDADSSKYDEIKDLLRPGQAEYTWREKYGAIDWRGGGRASARETATRVAGGAIALKLLKKHGIEIVAYSKEIAGIVADSPDLSAVKLGKIRNAINSNNPRSPDLEMAQEMEYAILSAKKEKDSVGGVIEAAVTGVPAGLGEPLFDKLSADISKAVMSIPGTRGVEIGAGFESARMKGSESNDVFFMDKGAVRTKTNNAGGIIGGISDGMPIILRIALKPTASIGIPQKTVDYKKKKETEIEITGRHDPCIVPRAVPVVESMLGLVFADHSIMAGYIPRRLQ